jgi:HK97 family phage major capsid protein
VAGETSNSYAPIRRAVRKEAIPVIRTTFEGTTFTGPAPSREAARAELRSLGDRPPSQRRDGGTLRHVDAIRARWLGNLLDHYKTLEGRSARAPTTSKEDPDMGLLSYKECRAEMRQLSELPSLTEGEEKRLAWLTELNKLHRRAIAADMDSDISEYRQGGPPGDLRTASRVEVRDRALKVLESEGRHLAPFQQDHVDRLLRTHSIDCDGSVIAKMLLVTETEAYRSGFQKAITQERPAFTADETRALNEYRVANEGTGSSGGFGLPVLIDPTVILSSGALEAPLLGISRMITITTDQWKGVSAPGVVWHYDVESAVVADGSVTMTQPAITVYKADAFIPYTVEVGQDYPGFADEMSKLMAQGYIDLLAANTCSGSGSSQPTGIFTAMAGTTSPAHIVVTTAGTLSATDVRKAWSTLPERFRPRATWVMNPTVEAQVRAFGNNLALSDFTVNLLANGTSVLTGRPVVVTDYAPAFTGTTGAANIAVVGDFGQFYIVQRAGMSVELVPHLFDPTSGRPIAERGWFAFARHGYSPVNTNAFRIISNS